MTPRKGKGEMMDLRNDLAKARDEWMENNPLLLSGSATGQYLRNRIEAAFIAGWNAREANDATMTSELGARR